jgi:hypothetical protein
MSRVDFFAWDNGAQKTFIDINNRSNVRHEWLAYEEVLKTEYKDSVIKPINKYMYKLSTPPKLISIENNVVTLCQENFAEIFLLEKNDKLMAIEKIHMRQFYLSDKSNQDNSKCFNPVFRWAMTWFIDVEGLEVNISPVENSPFYFHKTSYISTIETSTIIDPRMLFFQFKNTGPHIKNDEYGRIKRGRDAYLITFKASDEIIDRIKEFYVNH